MAHRKMRCRCPRAACLSRSTAVTASRHDGRSGATGTVGSRPGAGDLINATQPLRDLGQSLWLDPLHVGFSTAARSVARCLLCWRIIPLGTSRPRGNCMRAQRPNPFIKIPHRRDEQGIPKAWVARMRESMAYRAADDGALGRGSVDWHRALEHRWSALRFGELRVGDAGDQRVRGAGVSRRSEPGASVRAGFSSQ